MNRQNSTLNLGLTMPTLTVNSPKKSVGHLLQIASPTLPIGSYAYSTGLEYAVCSRWVCDQQSAHSWISGVALHSICHLDVPVLSRLLHAWQENDAAKVLEWSRFLVASRESAELLAEDRQMGVALAKLLYDLGIEPARYWINAPEASWATLFSLAAFKWEICEHEAQQAYLWAWCEHQISAAVKLVPLGQTSGQQILLALSELIPEWVEYSSTLEDSDLGQGTPALAIGSALHEQQYSRLFRS